MVGFANHHVDGHVFPAGFFGQTACDDKSVSAIVASAAEDESLLPAVIPQADGNLAGATLSRTLHQLEGGDGLTRHGVALAFPRLGHTENPRMSYVFVNFHHNLIQTAKIEFSYKVGALLLP